jgi:RNA polymerase sigma-70 factor (ECF subfamily)
MAPDSMADFDNTAAANALPPKALLEHATSLRRLALALLRDSHDADDAVQETWVRALEAPPGRLEALGGWLRTVLTNVVISKRRAQQRQAVRELDVARSAVQPDTRERERTLRCVIDAVLALDEPLKTVVLLRHFEGLAPREIALRLRVPPSVVYNRLQRAHDRLRVKLEREDRSWAMVLGVLAGAKRPPIALTGAGVTSGVILMSLKTQVSVLAAAAVLATAFFVWRANAPASSAAAPQTSSEVASLDGARGTPAAPANAAVDALERTPVADAVHEEAAVRPVPPYDYEVQFHVTDGDDAPLIGATVFLAPPSHPLDAAGQTDGEGKLTVRWHAFVESMEVAVGASSGGDTPSHLRRAHIVAGSEQHVTLRTTAPRWVFSIMLGNETIDAAAPAGVPVLSEVPLVSRLFLASGGAETPAMILGVDGFSQFVDPWIAGSIRAQPQARLDAVSASIELGVSGEFVARRRMLLDFDRATEEKQPDQPPHFVLIGQVKSVGDKPLGDVLVRTRNLGAPNWNVTRTDENGEYRSEMPTGDVEIAVGDGDNGTARGRVAGATDATVRFDCVLDRGRELHGRLFSADHKPLAKWAVELARNVALDPWIDVATTDEEGFFRIPSLPGGAFALLARPANSEATVPIAVTPAAWPSDETQEFTAAPSAFAGFHAELVDDRGEPVAGAVAVLWRDEVDRGERIEASGEHANELAADQQFAGDYRLEIGASQRGWTAIAHVFLEPGKTLDLGRIVLPSPGQLEIAAPTPASGEPFRAVFVRRGAQVESLSNALECTAPAVIDVVAGELECAVDLNHLARTEKLTIRAGETLPHAGVVEPPKIHRDG